MRVRVIVALVAGFGLLSACASDEPAPAQAARAFVAAAQSGDPARVASLLESKIGATLGAAAERASDQVGGRASFERAQMLELVQVDRRFRLRSVEVLEDDGSEARVWLIGDHDQTQELRLIYESGSWRVRIPAHDIVRSAP